MAQDRAPNDVACVYHQQGYCNRGTECAYRHDVRPSNQHYYPPYPTQQMLHRAVPGPALDPYFQARPPEMNYPAPYYTQPAVRYPAFDQYGQALPQAAYHPVLYAYAPQYYTVSPPMARPVFLNQTGYVPPNHPYPPAPVVSWCPPPMFTGPNYDPGYANRGLADELQQLSLMGQDQPHAFYYDHAQSHHAEQFGGQSHAAPAATVEYGHGGARQEAGQRGRGRQGWKEKVPRVRRPYVFDDFPNIHPLDNPMILPSRPGGRLCTFFHRIARRQCPYGASCKYDHPSPRLLQAQIPLDASSTNYREDMPEPNESAPS